MNSAITTPFDLTGKRALITGSAEGIGFAIAKQFASQGCSVIIHDKDNEDRCERACEELQRIAKQGFPYVLADFEHPDAVEHLAESAPTVDILVLNASMQLRRDILSISRAEFDSHLNTNLWSSLRLIQYFLPSMVEQRWGRIITVGSIQQIKPHPEMAVYAALKAAVSNIVVNLAMQFGQYGVTVNNIAPGVVETRRNKEVLRNDVYADQIRRKIPLGYFGQPEDCAGLALMLCSEAGRYITGQTIFCDGGMATK